MLNYQKQRVALMQQLLLQFSTDFVLKGGTALMICYGLNRYSEDIDLDSREDMDITGYLKNPGCPLWNVRVAKDTPTVFRVMLDYGAQTMTGGAYPLKIEVSARNKKMLKNGIYIPVQVNGITVYSIETIAAMKVATFSQRDKIRDLFDIGFLLQNYPAIFDKNQLIAILENISYKGLDTLSILLQDEFQHYNLGDLSADEYCLNIAVTCENLLKESKGTVLG